MFHNPIACPIDLIQEDRLYLESEIIVNVMLKQLISTEKLNAYQRLQMEHDKTYHHEIFVLDISRRMNHIALHLAKYLYPLFSLPLSAPENQRAFIDAFIMVASASNLLGIPLSIDLVIDDLGNTSATFINTYIQLLAELAKGCEATDHQEDYPIRATWNKTIQKFFSLLVREASLRNISLLEEATHRLASVEKKHPLDNILREEE
ncbi:hypothetical protein H6G17_01595 [Chroococcidiopsis sp. FACHB-1243]|uniref:hypothetical protein n=1 Tax=Chroococcidiopsis sp. [FACHB-1243] TaxID=2692781 RepID=UPI0017846730|nr:hypothetical protein [Chroococcidiopsis sp. [FACHB-1243]]MBD2304216.1 hypothetical protein [Chroococcidiopsis sp. [FACHB-1243]]